MNELYRLGMWPLIDFSERNSIDTIIEKLDDYKEFAQPTDACRCLRDSALRSEVTDSVVGALANQKGLCLDCVKKGRLGGLNDNCMASRSGECRHRASTEQ